MIVEENLYDVEYVREQTDLPILVREDDGRFLRHADVVRGGRESQFYFWDEVSDRLAEVPGCLEDGDGGRSLALGKLRPALSGRHRVRLADGREVAVRPVFDGLRERLAEYTLEARRRADESLTRAPIGLFRASAGGCAHGDDLRLLGRLQALPQ